MNDDDDDDDDEEGSGNRRIYYQKSVDKKNYLGGGSADLRRRHNEATSKSVREIRNPTELDIKSDKKMKSHRAPTRSITAATAVINRMTSVQSSRYAAAASSAVASTSEERDDQSINHDLDYLESDDDEEELGNKDDFIIGNEGWTTMREMVHVASSSSSPSSSSSSSDWYVHSRENDGDVAWSGVPQTSTPLEVSCLVLANPVVPLADVVWTYLRGYGMAVRAEARSQRIEELPGKGYKLSLDLDPSLLTVTEPNLTIAVRVIDGWRRGHEENRKKIDSLTPVSSSSSLFSPTSSIFPGLPPSFSKSSITSFSSSSSSSSSSLPLFAPSEAYKDEFTLVYSFEPKTICPSSVALHKGIFRCDVASLQEGPYVCMSVCYAFSASNGCIEFRVSRLVTLYFLSPLILNLSNRICFKVLLVTAAAWSISFSSCTRFAHAEKNWNFLMNLFLYYIAVLRFF